MTNFAYNRDIPDGPNNPSVDQPDMKINTNAIDDLLAVDHVSFNLNNGGLHNQVTLLSESAPGLRGGNGVLYTNAFVSDVWPIWQNTAGTTLIIGPGQPVSNGYQYLAGGLLIQWGSVSTAGGSGTISFPIAFPNNAFSITTSYNRSSTSSAHTVYTTSLTQSQFTYASDSTSISNLYWMAIGN
jgi:hypothetical protein